MSITNGKNRREAVRNYLITFFSVAEDQWEWMLTAITAAKLLDPSAFVNFAPEAKCEESLHQNLRK